VNAKLVEMRNTELDRYQGELYREKSSHLLRWQVGEPWQGLDGLLLK
jgi:hypothetical protein